MKNSLVLWALAVVTLTAAAGAKVDVDHTAGPSGIYTFEDGRRLYLAPLVDENGATLQFTFSDGLVGRARKEAPSRFADTDPCAHRFVVVDDDRVEYSDCSAKATARLSVKLDERPTTFRASDGRSIAGSIWTAHGFAPRAGVVLAHGADDETRQMGVLIPQLAEAGLAVLSFDQRGTGASEGNWRSDGIERIAADMVQAAQLLQSEAKIAQVGFFGFSNGGWAAPAAAARFKDAAFVVIKSGDSQSVEDNVIFETRTAVERNAGAVAAGRATDVMRSLFAALHTDAEADWAAARKKLADVQGEPWLRYTQLPPVQAFPLPAAVKEGFRHQLFFDPREDLKKIACPVLVMLGDMDIDVEGPRSAALYRAYFRESGNTAAKVELLEGAGHQLVQGPGAAANNSMATGRYAAQYPRNMVSWLGRVIDSHAR
ncbi:alpha/beta hydrolase [Ramlibacter sp. MMS24-I3-19]|uniref:alpha/beta hydrolase n=1 Tax=Ramlibacter sp. MMS24-I3-19 TaxID=3416606 RepID=UPI003D06ACAC